MRTLLLTCAAFLAASASAAEPAGGAGGSPETAASRNESSRGATGPRGPVRARPDAEAAHFRRLDADRDGRLSDAELDARAADRSDWIALDRDGDGRISRDEFLSVR